MSRISNRVPRSIQTAPSGMTKGEGNPVPIKVVTTVDAGDMVSALPLLVHTVSSFPSSSPQPEPILVYENRNVISAGTVTVGRSIPVYVTEGVLFGGTGTVRSATPATFTAVWGDMVAGDVMVLEDGTYTDVIRSLNKDDIHVCARNPGSVTFDGTSLLSLDGTRVHVEGLVFDGIGAAAVARFDGGQECRLSNCKFLNCGTDVYKYRHIIQFHNGAADNVVENILMDGNDAMGIGFETRTTADPPIRNTVRHCWFKNVLTDSGKEVVQLGQGDSGTKHYDTYNIVEHNVFQNVDGDAEAVSNKTSSNTIRDNLFLDSDGSIVLREGEDCIVERNFASNVASGIRIHGEGHTLRGNVVVSSAIGLTIPAGDDGTADNAVHDAAANILLEDNAFLDCDKLFLFDDWYNGTTYDLYPSNVTLNRTLLGAYTGDVVLDAVQDIFTWNGNEIGSPDGSISSSPDASKYTFLSDMNAYLSRISAIYPDLSVAELSAFAVSEYGTRLLNTKFSDVGPNW